MTLDDVLLVGNFVGSLVALVIALVSLPPGRRGPTQKGQTPPPALDQRKGVRIAATTTAVLATIIVTAALLLFRSRAHDHAVAQVQNEIVEAIAGDLLTFDDLHQQLIYHSFPEVYEALFLLINAGTICHRPESPVLNGKILRTRSYRLCVPPIGK